MSTPDRDARSRRSDPALAAGVLVALVAAMLPLLRVVDAGWWMAGAVALPAAVLLIGVVSRRRRLPALAVTLLELVVLVLFLTAGFAGTTAFLWVIPTLDTVQLVPPLVAAAVQEIQVGSAPLTAGTALSFLIVGVMGLLAIVFDHVVLTARLPLLAAVGLVAISLVPSIAVPGEIDLFAFALLAASLLFLLRVDTRSRGGAATASAGTGASPVRSRGGSATALGIGAVAVVVAVVAAPLLPAPVARAGGGMGTSGSFIDPSLQLGDDLRQPREIEVLQVRSTAPTAPYLRAVTLSAFDGAVWEPDDGRNMPLNADGADFEPVAVDPGIEVAEYRTTVDVIDLNSPWLPVSSPAVDVNGLEGEWTGLAGNRTVVGANGTSAQGQAYEVVSTVPRPTLEQIREREAGGDVRDDTLELPDGMPAVIEETARQVTGSAQNDYDALAALQSWFRSTQFRYSLDAPVDDGFDGTGADAVADFLEVREGYCVHFASAFALMARTLGMPARIVVGYLPGSNTGSLTDGQSVYSVQSSQLHAWPEVHFDGIGWVSFEPTNSLGVPTGFAPASTASTPNGGATPAPAPRTATPQPTSSATPGALLPDEPQAGGGSTATRSSSAPWLLPGVIALLVIALAVPALLREIRRRRALARAATGDAGAAWRSVQDLAQDLGIAVPGAESPRAFGSRLVAEHGAPSEPMSLLVSGIERASYAEQAGGAPLADALTVVETGLRSSVPAWRRALARVAPRSLVARPSGGAPLRGARARTT